MASYGSVSSFKMVKRGLSHRFLESGASNLSTRASKLQHKTTGQRKTSQRSRWRGRQGRKRIRAEAHALTGPGCTALQRPCPGSTMSSLHRTSNSTPARRGSRIKDRILTSVKCGYFQLEASWMLTRQWGVCACLMRQKSSYL